MEKDVERAFERLHERLDDFQDLFTQSGVHTEQITTLKTKVKDNCDALDTAFGQKGVVTRIREFQSSCPRKNFMFFIKSLWVVMVAGFGGVGTVITILHMTKGA